MSRKIELPHRKRHLIVYDEDWTYLDDRFGVYSASRLGTGNAIRQIIHKHVLRMRQAEQDRLDQQAQTVRALVEEPA